MEMVRVWLSLRRLRFHSLRAYRWMVMRILAKSFLETNQMDLLRAVSQLQKKWKNINENRVGKNRLVLWNINYRRKTKNKINQIKCELCENKMVSENENWYFFFFCLQFAAGMENEMATKWDSFRERCELGFMFKKIKWSLFAVKFSSKSVHPFLIWNYGWADSFTHREFVEIRNSRSLCMLFG